MKLTTVPVRPAFAIGAVGLAAVSTAVLVGLPSLTKAPEARLAAAASAPPAGAYWHTKVLFTMTNPRKLGTKANPYWVVERRLSEQWTTPEGRTWVGYRTAGAYPKSAADRAAWRRDGSPKKWTRTADGRTVSLSTEPDKGHVAPVRGDTTFFLAGQRLTYDEVQRLPAKPDALKSWLAEAARVSRADESAVDRFVTSALPDLLHRLPAPREVRAAAYQALLTMPGVRPAGEKKDGVGRTGAAVSIDYPETRQGKNTFTSGAELIIDTGTMLLLSEGHTSTINGKPFLNKTTTQAVLQAGWTDAEPAVPTLP
ncbi:hypothetical protein GBF35_45480 [Nonomuraea phyllanthi]|uniref:hypothetical protein n=1 Tax=Nonomuraea phyllanthi TaxID=2219224 RepID=UPI001293BA24|nr:hypothetical protein [Nonomuraea phyllanthi]QFY12862.1 hypothetical protein GBF35_45480 [Nonomuraea phyllanthi]